MNDDAKETPAAPVTEPPAEDELLPPTEAEWQLAREDWT